MQVNPNLRHLTDLLAHAILASAARQQRFFVDAHGAPDLRPIAFTLDEAS